ncbi:GNAT family N-acetyltransferase [Streptomyces decoyicus]|uniref:GNAT family N-acetyltransferase n=1 Tax=Streptomyces decoyicus TaxID=249567 RepID=UPI0004AA31F7|nr:GNAT family N-acetyltransferase [Streptomyces decoyicus]KOG41977.1 GCN5 family acetyltransferase [Streptomyces decoyicus]QZY14109.1 GNAT family N-acetyltransferase [Streptomyces decoyicus]
MTDPYLLRPVTDDEFAPWARMVANTYNEDRSDEELADKRATVELARTIGAFDGETPVGGTAAYARCLAVPGAVLPVAGVTWVGVAATHRRRGILTAMMRKQLTDLHECGGEPIAVLRPSEAAIYGRFGYGPATRGAQLRCEKRSMVFRPGTAFGDGTIRLLGRDEARPLIERVYDQVRTGAVGRPDRTDRSWDSRLCDEPQAREGATSLRFAVHQDPGGHVTGYALYRIRTAVDVFGNNNGAVQVMECVTTCHQAYAALWRFLAGIDLVPWIEYEAAVDEPLPHLLTDPRAVRSTQVDRLWVRLVDVDRALAGRRYATPLDLVLDVEDSFCPWNTGRYRLQADGDAVACKRTHAPADLQLTATELGAAFLGGTTLASLAAAGRVSELQPGALARASSAFRGDREPFYPGGWAFPAY